MKDLAIKAVVTSADGFYYREEHEWRNMDQNSAPAKLIAEKMKEAADYAQKASSSGGDDGLTATLSTTIDGGAQADVVVNGLSYEEVSKFQRKWQKWGDELVGHGEKLAKDKDRKRGWGGGGGGGSRDRERGSN